MTMIYDDDDYLTIGLIHITIQMTYLYIINFSEKYL